jgi:hypothetical protein
MNFGEIIREDGQILLEMANIGSFDGFTIYIYGSEGPKPHFHLIKGNPKYPDFETCIEINNPICFHHSGKEGVLSSKEKKRLIEFLKSNNKYFPDKTNWQVLVVQWSMNNADFELSPETKMPDYQNL